MKNIFILVSVVCVLASLKEFGRQKEGKKGKKKGEETGMFPVD